MKTYYRADFICGRTSGCHVGRNKRKVMKEVAEIARVISPLEHQPAYLSLFYDGKRIATGSLHYSNSRASWGA